MADDLIHLLSESFFTVYSFLCLQLQIRGFARTVEFGLWLVGPRGENNHGAVFPVCMFVPLRCLTSQWFLDLRL